MIVIPESVWQPSYPSSSCKYRRISAVSTCLRSLRCCWQPLPAECWWRWEERARALTLKPLALHLQRGHWKLSLGSWSELMRGTCQNGARVGQAHWTGAAETAVGAWRSELASRLRTEKGGQINDSLVPVCQCLVITLAYTVTIPHPLSEVFP